MVIYTKIFGSCVISWWYTLRYWILSVWSFSMCPMMHKKVILSKLDDWSHIEIRQVAQGRTLLLRCNDILQQIRTGFQVPTQENRVKQLNGYTGSGWQAPEIKTWQNMCKGGYTNVLYMRCLLCSKNLHFAVNCCAQIHQFLWWLIGSLSFQNVISWNLYMSCWHCLFSSLWNCNFPFSGQNIHCCQFHQFRDQEHACKATLGEYLLT